MRGRKANAHKIEKTFKNKKKIENFLSMSIVTAQCPLSLITKFLCH